MIEGIYLLLGSNMGDKRSLLTDATHKIEGQIGIVLNSSRLYLTGAWGVKDQPDFLNQVLEIESELEPYGILKKIALAWKSQASQSRARNTRKFSKILCVHSIFEI